MGSTGLRGTRDLRKHVTQHELTLVDDDRTGEQTKAVQKTSPKQTTVSVLRGIRVFLTEIYAKRTFTVYAIDRPSKNKNCFLSLCALHKTSCCR